MECNGIRGRPEFQPNPGQLGIMGVCKSFIEQVLV